MNSSAKAHNPIRKRISQFNSLKLRALAAFENRDWMQPVTWAAITGFNPARASYTYLLRLTRFGLLQRGRGINGLLFYRITDRGKQRLAWLRNSFAKSKTKEKGVI